MRPGLLVLTSGFHVCWRQFRHAFKQLVALREHQVWDAPIMIAKKMYCASWTSRLMGDLHQLSRNRCPKILT